MGAIRVPEAGDLFKVTHASRDNLKSNSDLLVAEPICSTILGLLRTVNFTLFEWQNLMQNFQQMKEIQVLE